ncbi:hypothetical protein [Streptomyces sp. URMC 129]|uniref:hypothetical protein n=1 Tax=Streptomyces sp. URMC 129 TaxID=3423407 RepID=UPI003F1AEB21
MGDNSASCRICGQFVLQVPGWTSVIPSYWSMRATWRPGHEFFHGPLHFSCLTGWEHREPFREELTQILTGRGREVTVEAGGAEHTVTQPGLYFSELLYANDDCSIHRNTSYDEWLVLTARGPWFTLGPKHLKALGEGRPARDGGGGERVVLPADPDPGIETAALPDLLDSLGVRSRYPGAVELGEAVFEFWGYYPKKRVLEYGVIADLPLPDTAVDFLAEYARHYEPTSFEELEDDLQQ